MKRLEHKILKKQIQSGSLVSLTSKNWFKTDGSLYPWTTGGLYIGPNIGDGIFNFTSSVDGLYTSSVSQGYYKWNGTSWITTPISGISESYNLPIFLESSVDEMGVMVSFDGEVEQVEQLCNFTYTITGNTLHIFNSINPDKLRKITEQEYTIDWGVKLNLTGSAATSPLLVNTGSLGTTFPSASFNYTNYTSSYSSSINTGIMGSFDVSIYLNSPWSNQRLTKTIIVPTSSVVENPFGYFTGYTLANGSLPTYLYGYEYQTGSTAITTGKTFTFMAMGKSRLGEFRQYGTTSFSTEVEIQPTYTGYTINGLYYMDYPDGYTKITGSVPNYVYDLTGYTYNSTGGTETYKFNLGSGSNFTPEYLDDRDITNYIINHRLTRNEHFLGFIDDPQVYSDIFVERGKQGVMENNLRLGEIDNMDELEIYGNGYFKVRKQ
jgi:hypothetical protein